MHRPDCLEMDGPVIVGGSYATCTEPAADKPRLLLIDPKPLTRSYLADSIRSTLPGSLTDIGDVQEASDLARDGTCIDAVILNLGDEEIDATTLGAAFAPVRHHFPDCIILLLTSQIDARGISAALWEGVQAYLTTDRSLEAMLDAIRFVCSGWLIYPSSGLTHLRSMLPRPSAVVSELIDPDELTPRQAEVLRCLAAGMSNRSIASHLRISQSTVKAHVKGIMLRSGATNRTQAVALLQAERPQRQAGCNSKTEPKSSLISAA